MNKLPVGRTIRFAYAFTLGEIGTVIGLIWIPTLINAVASFFAMRIYYQVMAESFESGAMPMGAQLLVPFLVAMLSMLLLCVSAVGVTKQALGQRKGPAFAYFALGSTELRAFGGFFGLYMLLVLVALVVLLVVAGAAAGGTIKGGAAVAPIAGAVAGLAGFAGFLALCYVAIRLSFLLIPSVIDGGEFGLSRSWELTKGNFWRIVPVGLATLAPLAILVGIAEYSVLGSDFLLSSPGEVKGTAANLRQMAQQMRAMQSQLPLLIGLGFVISPLMYGLMFAPSAFAYRVLSGKAVLSDRTE